MRAAHKKSRLTRQHQAGKEQQRNALSVIIAQSRAERQGEYVRRNDFIKNVV